MIRGESLLAKLNGWALSIALHGAVGMLAALSAFSLSSRDGGSGWGSGGGAAGGGSSAQTYEAGLHSEDMVSGERLDDPAQYGHLTEDVPEPDLAEEPTPPAPAFDIFGFGSSEVLPTQPPPVVSDPLTSRPASAEERSVKLPPPSGQDGPQDGPGTEKDSPAGTAQDAGTGGPGGSGGGTLGGNGKGEGTGVGDAIATEVYTPTPAYPSDARRRNIQGIVLVELEIEADGSCKCQKIVESSGCDSLDDAVAKTVSHWKYRSASADGRPDVISKRVRFVFRLGDKDR